MIKQTHFLTIFHSHHYHSVEEIDPFYTVDLTDPTDPQVVGELKIPGFSVRNNQFCCDSSAISTFKPPLLTLLIFFRITSIPSMTT